MATITEQLLAQIKQAQWLGQKILAVSSLTNHNVIYAFATDRALVINCQDYETTWQFDEHHCDIWQAITRLKLPIQTIQIERQGKVLYNF